MKNILSKVIPLFAGSITILNFFLSFIPVVSNKPIWYIQSISGMNNQLRFITVTVFTLIASYAMVKAISKIDRGDFFPSSKMTLVAISTVIFAWIVVFNVKVIAFNNDISSDRGFLFFWVCCFFSLFSSIKLHYDFQFLGYTDYYNGEGEFPFWKSAYSPIYIRTIRFLTFWITFIIGAYIVAIA